VAQLQNVVLLKQNIMTPVDEQLNGFEFSKLR